VIGTDLGLGTTPDNRLCKMNSTHEIIKSVEGKIRIDVGTCGLFLVRCDRRLSRSRASSKYVLSFV
jgi:hypothetical protein